MARRHGDVYAWLHHIRHHSRLLRFDLPASARNTPKTKGAREKLDQGTIDTEEYEKVEMLERNRLSIISTAHSNC